jgi:hypothetical protein
MMARNCVLRRLSILAAGICGAALLSGPARAAPTVIELTQVACQFLESENGVDHGFEASEKADCEAINERSAEERLDKAKVIELEPGDYIFRVTNVDVPYTLGFWIRGDGVINRATLPSVSGGGLNAGMTKDYEIELKPGEYVYSCPLNPTLDYKLVVKDS